MAFLLRQLGYLAIAAVACLYAFAVLKGPNGFPAMIDKWNQVQTMHDSNELLRREVEHKKAAIEQLKNNRTARDHAVRESTGKTPPNDLTIIVPEAPKAH
jgi:cell division protein FtsB